ncbi:probable terpene synthase 3 [Hevea brasiliensis]|uniref:probable terpene synthase 3 n=1 Tax=Hevea brasiliensis TaxID=3981 RepID=UPI0025F48D9A|nr:probable terpene synthase 3 [Hevea brasiliensis]
MATQFGSPLADQVSHALRWPIRRRVPRKGSRGHFSIYQLGETHIEPSLKLAKLDYNIGQTMHQKDMSSVTKWWRDLDFTAKRPFARDKVIESSLWALGTFSEPQHIFARKVLSKAVTMLSVMDDIYMCIVQLKNLSFSPKWDISMKDELPDYVKVYFEAFLDFYAEIEAITVEAAKKQVRAYVTEARWFNSDYVPTLEEYRSAAVTSTGYPILVSLSFCGMGEVASKEAFDWLSTEPKLLYAASGLSRLIDDLRSHEKELLDYGLYRWKVTYTCWNLAIQEGERLTGFVANFARGLVEEAELKALYEGIKMAQGMGFRRVVVESGNKNVVKVVNSSKGFSAWEMGFRRIVVESGNKNVVKAVNSCKGYLVALQFDFDDGQEANKEKVGSFWKIFLGKPAS